jgi:hypothetical protein
MFLILDWIDVVTGTKSNYEFFMIINGGWLQMEFNNLYGDNPTEDNEMDWMLKNAETIYVSSECYDLLINENNNSRI